MCFFEVAALAGHPFLHRFLVSLARAIDVRSVAISRQCVTRQSTCSRNWCMPSSLSQVNDNAMVCRLVCLFEESTHDGLYDGVAGEEGGHAGRSIMLGPLSRRQPVVDQGDPAPLLSGSYSGSPSRVDFN